MLKCFIISVLSNTESLSGAKNIQTRLTSYGHEAYIFAGTDSILAPIRQKKEGRTVDGNYKNLHPNYYQRILKPGVLGCFYSHYELWSLCVKLNETILIFEDDVELVRDFIPVEIDDVLLLSVDFKVYRSMEEDKFVDMLRVLLDSPSGPPASIPYVCNSIIGACGYAITPMGASKLLDRYATTYEAVDVCINSTNVNIRITNYLMGEPRNTKSLTL